MREETKKHKLRTETGKRAVKYEEKMSERTKCKMPRECRREEEKREMGMEIKGMRRDEKSTRAIMHKSISLLLFVVVVV